jgi:hypothetical protein
MTERNPLLRYCSLGSDKNETNESSKERGSRSSGNTFRVDGIVEADI